MTVIKCKNGYYLGETTLEMKRIDFAPIGESALTYSADRQRESLVSNILVGAGVISDSEVEMARTLHEYTLIEYVRIFLRLSPQTCQSFEALVDQVYAGKLTVQQGIVAANHIHITGLDLSSALDLVTARSQSLLPTIIEFLMQLGLICKQDVARLALPESVEPKIVAARLLTEGLIDCRSLRNATRLRWLLINGKINLEDAKQALHNSIRTGFDVEECVKRYA